MSTGRTPGQKAADASLVYALLREEITDENLRKMQSNMNEQMANQAIQNDPAAYINVVQTSLSLNRIIAANDRAAMIAAAMLTSGGVARPILEDEGV